MTIVSVDDGF
jgi:hypothetical protein